MALLFMDGFDGGDMSSKWTSGNLGANATTRFGTGRSLSGSFASMTKTIPATSQIFVGYATMFNGGNHSVIMALYGDSGTVAHLALYHNTSTYQLELRRGTNWNGGTLLGTTTTRLFPNCWNYVEISATISDTVGSVQVRLNGSTTPEITFSGDTRNGGVSTNIDMLYFSTWGDIGNGGVGSGFIDDVYIADATGTTNNTFLGDVRVHSLAPTGNGTDSGLTGSDGNQVNNYLLANTMPVQTTTYNGAQFAGRDTYQMADLPATVANIFAVQNNVSAAKNNNNSAVAKSVLRLGGNFYYSSQLGITTAYRDYPVLYELNPNSGITWTAADVNGAESGLEVS
jgi:hypothetical protein